MRGGVEKQTGRKWEAEKSNAENVMQRGGILKRRRFGPPLSEEEPAQTWADMSRDGTGFSHGKG